MFDELLGAVRAEVSGARALESVRDIARHHRVQASPGYDDAAHWLAGRLEAFGLSPEIESVPGDGTTRRLGALMPEGWECRHARAVLIDGARRETLCDVEAEPLSLVIRSAKAAGRFRLVALEDGSEPEHYDGVDVSGAVVLTGAAVHRVHALAVLARGAAGVLYDGRRLLPPVRDRLDDPDALTYTSFWWSGDEPRGWGFVVSPRTGARLRERLRAGARLDLDVAIDSRRFATTIPLVSAVLPGTSGHEVLLLAHLCHPRPSANDNASGAAAALEAMRALAALRARGAWSPGTVGVRTLWMPELTGTQAWLAADPARAGRTAAALNLDMVGENQEACGSTFLLEHPPCFAATFAEELALRIRARAVDWVPTYSGPGHFSMTRMAEVPYSGGSDHAVLVDPAIGVPCPMLIQWPDRYYHSSHDTPDRCDPASLALAARTAATYAGFLATLDAPRRAWLTRAVGRGARRRLLAALDHDAPERAVRAERLRGWTALASLTRLGVPEDAIAAERSTVDVFVAREGAPGEAVPPAGTQGVTRLLPRRLQHGPLDAQRHLIAGWAAVPPEEREAWRHGDLESDGAATRLELAWFACDGRRSVEEIAELGWLETGRWEPDAIAGFFERAARLGLVALAGEEEPDERLTPRVGSVPEP